VISNYNEAVSAMNEMKRGGSRTEPCGTRRKTGIHLDLEFPEWSSLWMSLHVYSVLWISFSVNSVLECYTYETKTSAAIDGTYRKKTSREMCRDIVFKDSSTYQ